MFRFSERRNPKPNEYAALDLGSNSFHMVVARQEQGELRMLDKLKEPVRLGFGLDDENRLDEAAQTRALECLARFGDRISHLPKGSVRCVGTKTLRSAINSQAFIQRAEAVLGHPIEIISGSEEARLIYQGVVHSLAASRGRRLVADIGGGSTELILGEGPDSDFKESLSMGCVAVTRRFFAGGRVTEDAVRRALLACAREIEPIRAGLLALKWSEEVGASGTIKSTYQVCLANGWADPGITLKGLKAICEHFIAGGRLEGSGLKGLSADREPVFLGGVIVLRALFEALDLRSMMASQGALREGLLLDLVGRYSDRDIREISVQALAGRFHVDTAQADRISQTALELLHQVAGEWSLDIAEGERYLHWASVLLEVGLDISHSQYHKHSAYICEHSDLPGFSIPEQQVLAFLVLAQRKKFPDKTWKSQRHHLDRSVRKLAVLLRLAVLMHRARSGRRDLPVTLQAKNKNLTLFAREDWLESQSLLQADLEAEVSYLKAVNMGLQIEAVGPA